MVKPIFRGKNTKNIRILCLLSIDDLKCSYIFDLFSYFFLIFGKNLFRTAAIWDILFWCFLKKNICFLEYKSSIDFGKNVKQNHFFIGLWCFILRFLFGFWGKCVCLCMVIQKQKNNTKKYFFPLKMQSNKNSCFFLVKKRWNVIC